MTGWLPRLVLVVSLLLTQSVFLPAADAPGCPSFRELARQVDVKIKVILGLKPGVALDEFTRKYASRALNFWNDVGLNRDTVFIVGAREGNAQVTDHLVCVFDRSDRLLSCRRECCRY